MHRVEQAARVDRVHRLAVIEMRELRDADGDERHRHHGIAQIPEVRERLFEHVTVIQTGDDHHLPVKLDAALGQPRELIHDIRDARVVEKNLPRFPRCGVHRNVQRRQAVLEDARDVLLFYVRQRREIAVSERQSVVVVADVETFPKTFRQSFDEAELTPIGAAADGGRRQFHAHRFPALTLDVVLDLRAIGQPR